MQKHAREQLAATLLLLLAAAPNTHSEEELPECEAGESPYMNKEKAPIQNMHQAAPQSDNRKAYAELPASVTTLTQEDFSFGEQIAQLSLDGGEPERPWIVDFYTTSRADVKKRLSEDDELSFLAAAELTKGICGFAVCNLNEAVKGRARAFPAYPATFAYAQTNMFRGRMFASPWKGNRTIRALVETCLDHAKQELAPELLAKLEAAEEAHAEKQAVWKAEQAEKDKELEEREKEKRKAREEAAEEYEKTASKVYELRSGSQASFDAMVLEQTQLTMVMFYAPWCDHCKALRPVWEEAAREFASMAKFVAVDATVSRQDWGRDHGVEGFPTIKLYRPHSVEINDAVVYKNTDKEKAHTLEGLSTFIGHHHIPTQGPAATEEEELELDRAEVDLDDDDEVEMGDGLAQLHQRMAAKNKGLKSDDLAAGARKKSGKGKKGGKGKKKKPKANKGIIESKCTACMCVADEIELQITKTASRTKKKDGSAHSVHEADIIDLLEPLCKTDVRGKYVLKTVSRFGAPGSDTEALPQGVGLEEWGLSGETLELGYSHADKKLKAQAEQIWKYCDGLLERVEEELVEELRKPNITGLLEEGNALWAESQSTPRTLSTGTGMRRLLCNVVAQECGAGEIRPRPEVGSTGSVIDPHEWHSEVTPEDLESGGKFEVGQAGVRRVQEDGQAGGQDDGKAPKEKAKPKKRKGRQTELEVITDEDISNVREVSPGVFVNNFDEDKLRAYLSGAPDELDMLACRLDDLKAKHARAVAALEKMPSGDDEPHREQEREVRKIQEEIERLKDAPVNTWGFGGEEDEGERTEGQVTWRALERGGSTPICGVSAAAEKASGPGEIGHVSAAA